MDILEDDKMPEHEFSILQENGEKVQKAMDQVETTLDTLNTKTNKLFRKPISRKEILKRQQRKYTEQLERRGSIAQVSNLITQRGDEMMTQLAESQSSLLDRKPNSLPLDHLQVHFSGDLDKRQNSLPMGGLYGELESVLESPSLAKYTELEMNTGEYQGMTKEQRQIPAKV